MNIKGGLGPTNREFLYLELKEFDFKNVKMWLIVNAIKKKRSLSMRQMKRALKAFFSESDAETLCIDREKLKSPKSI